MSSPPHRSSRLLHFFFLGLSTGALQRSRSWPVVLALVILLAGCGDTQVAPKPPEPEVVVVPVAKQDVQLQGEWVGTTEGMVTATIRPKISGYLVAQEYLDGSDVEEGQVLFRIDPRQYKAALNAAKGELGAARAVLGKAEIDVERYTPLAARGAVSQQELDDAIQARAAGRARVASAAAAVEVARLDLAWTEIHSPISGIAGIATAQIGDLVNPAATLTTVSQVNPIKVTFPISEIEYIHFKRQADARDAEGEAPEERPLTMTLADGGVYEHPGKLSVVGREVSGTTGTIQIQGLFPNPGNLLRPGQYAKIQAPTEVRSDALVIPQRAVSQLQGIDQVSVVDQSGKVHVLAVTLGPRFGEQWVVEKGLKAGDQVVVEGLQKIRNGMTVKTKPVPDPTKKAAAKTSAVAPPAKPQAGS